MGANTKIMLPLHVRSEHILQVVGKCVGVSFVKEAFEGNNGVIPEFDPDAPGSNQNPWHITFKSRQSFQVLAAQGDRLDFGQMLFTDIAGQAHGWYFHQETDTEDHKRLDPPSSSLGVAVGRRLVRFFGGHVQYNDGNSAPHMHYRRSPKTAHYPPPARRMLDEDCEPNIRWYLFQNALDVEPLVSIKELQQASKLAAYGLTDRDKLLMERLVVEEESLQMKQALRGVPAAPSRPTPRL